MALSDRFHNGYDRLVGAFTRHRAAPREPERVVELASARADLEDSRSEMAELRRAEGWKGWRRHNPDFVDPRLRSGSDRRSSKVLALVAGLVLVGGLLALFLAILDFRSGDVLDVRVVSEEIVTTDTGCSWEVGVDITHVAEGVGMFRLVAIQVDARYAGNTLEMADVGTGFANQMVGFGDNSFAAVTVPLPNCDAALGDVDHGALRVTYAPPTGALQTIEADF